MPSKPFTVVDLDRAASPLQTLELLLSEAGRIADALKLDLAAIKIEEALLIARNQVPRCARRNPLDMLN